MLRRISIFWIIFVALLVTSAVPLGLVAFNAIRTTSAEVEDTQREQLLKRVQANASTINEQFRQFEITTNVAATRARELLVDEVKNLALDAQENPERAEVLLETRLDRYGTDPIGVYGLDNFYRNLNRDGWEALGYTIREADLEKLEIYATRLGTPLTEEEWAAYGFSIVDDSPTSAELRQINREDIPTTLTRADFERLGFTIISSDPARRIITADQIGRVPSPEVINVSNVYVNSLIASEGLPEFMRRQIATTEQLDDLFGTIRSEDFGSQWLYLTTAEGMMRLYPWHPNQYGPPYVWRVWQPQTILFYTAASDQGVKILQNVDGTVEQVAAITDGPALQYFRDPSAFPVCDGAVQSEPCVLDCSVLDAPLHNLEVNGQRVCPTNEGLVVLQVVQTPNLVRQFVADDVDPTPLCYGDGALQDGIEGTELDGTCYVDCSDTSDPLTAQFCNVACANSADPLQQTVCGNRDDGVIHLEVGITLYDADGNATATLERPFLEIVEDDSATTSQMRIAGITKEDYPSCPADGVTDTPCYVDCAIGVDELHPLHEQYCRGPVWTAPYYDYAGQGLMVTNSIPIYDGGNAPIAVMSHDLRIDVMEQQVLSITDEESGAAYAFFLDSNGQIIAHPRFQASQFAEEQALIGASVFRKLAEAEPEIASVVEQIIDGGTGVTSYEDANGKTWIIAYSEIESTGWHLGLAQPRDEIIAPANEITDQVFFGAAGALVIVLITAFLLARGITRPVLKLSNTAKEIEASVDDETGEVIGQNLDSLKHLSSAREIANLSNVFEQMVMALQRRMVELNSIYAMGQTITANVEYEETLRAVLNAVRTVVDYDAAEVSILRGNNLVVEAWQGAEGFNDTTGRKYRLGRGPTGQIGEQKQSLLLSTVSSGEDLQRTLGYTSPGSEFLAKTTKIVINSFLGIPLMIGDRLIGTLTLVHREPGHFDADDERQLNKLAAQASVAIQNAIQVRERERQLKRQIEELRIEIDQSKVKQQIEEVTDSDFFRGLQANARQMRRRFGKSVEDTDTTERNPDAEEAQSTSSESAADSKPEGENE